MCFGYITYLFNKWADEGEKNISNLLPKPIGLD